MAKNIWAGSEDSYKLYLDATPKAQAKEAEFKAAAGDGQPDFPPLYRLEGSVGIVSITGSLIPGRAEFYRYFGLTGYGDINDALIEAVKDKGAKSIMLYVDSGGGAVAGCAELSSFIKTVSTVKPMSAYADFMASAAYWTGSSAGHITLGETALAGSIGVIRVLREYSKMYEKEGVTTTVMRAGKFKALANPYEPLTEAAKADIQEKLDDMYESFINAVSDNRAVAYKVADLKMGQGREFIGKRALEVGLVDQIGSFEDAIAYAKQNQKLVTSKAPKVVAAVAATLLNASLLVDNAVTSLQTGNSMKLTAEQLAALAAGATLASVTGQEPPEPTPEELLAATAAKEAEEALAKAPVQEDAPVLPEPKADSEVVAFLKAELATANASLLKATTELASANAKAETLEAAEAALKPIVTGMLKNMGMSMRKPIETDGLTSAALAELHTATVPVFNDVFKVGGVAQSTASTEQPAKVVQLFSPRELAAAMSINVSKK